MLKSLELLTIFPDHLESRQMTQSEKSETRIEPDAERLISDLETLKVYFDPMRARIVRTISHDPRTVHEIAKELDVPFTRLYYHMNMLEKHGIIRVVETRNLSGAVEEKYYQIAARMFTVDRALLTINPGDESSKGLEVVMETVLENTQRDIRHSAQDGMIDLTKTSPDPEAILLRRGMVRMSKERATYFHERLLALIEDFVDEEESADQYYGFALAFYHSSLPYRAPEEEVNNTS